MSSYTGEQRALLLDAAAEVLVAAVAAERTGPIQYFREIMAAGRYLYDARRRYRDNALVQDLFSHAEERNVDLDEVTREKLLKRIEEVGSIVHDDAEGTEFKRFLLELAERVAEASRSGLFGRRLSPNETVFLDQLKERLGLPDA
jgi:hypothetical protein